MQRTPLDVLVATYPSEQGAEAALRDLASAGHSGRIRVRAAVTLRRDTSDDLHIIDGYPGALLGGLSGVVIGVIAGPLSWDKLGGARISELAARLQDGDFLDELRHLGRRLPSGWSTIVTVVEHHGLRQAKQLVREQAIEASPVPVAGHLADTS
jgi:uncharacterized membrane protein